MPVLTQPTFPSRRRRPWLWIGLSVAGVVLLLFGSLAAWVPTGTVEYYPGIYRVLLGRYRESRDDPAYRSGFYWSGGWPGGRFRFVLPGDRFLRGCVMIEWEPWRI